MSRGRVTRQAVLELLGSSEVASSDISAAFGVTRQAVHNHLKELELDGVIEMVGAGRGARWKRTFSHGYEWEINDDSREDEMWNQVKEDLGADLDVSDRALSILNYGVTEMLNNALDHSDGTLVALNIDVGDTVVISIADNGVGAFERVRSHFDLNNHLEAIVHVSKGQQTTDPSRHSGQGLHFTSRAFDQFHIKANGHIWKRDNIIDDSALGDALDRPGTTVLLTLAANTDRILKDVFDTDSHGDNYAFDHTTYPVRLADHGNHFMSRSEAKRITDGLDRYRVVELDFSGVTEIGQGFVDEVFRVWAVAHPDTTIVAQNTSETVQFMIDRGLRT